MVWLKIMYGTGVILPRVSIRRTPVLDGQLRLVPKVSVLEKFDCSNQGLKASTRLWGTVCVFL